MRERRFCHVDMKTTTFMLRVVKRVFPTFEFTWLGTFLLERFGERRELTRMSRRRGDGAEPPARDGLPCVRSLREHFVTDPFFAGHEAANAARCASDFSDLDKTTLYVPEVLWAKKRAMVMECAFAFFFLFQSALTVLRQSLKDPGSTTCSTSPSTALTGIASLNSCPTSSRG